MIQFNIQIHVQDKHVIFPHSGLHRPPPNPLRARELKNNTQIFALNVAFFCVALEHAKTFQIFFAAG